jgi:hypothetical protein
MTEPDLHEKYCKAFERAKKLNGKLHAGTISDDEEAELKRLQKRLPNMKAAANRQTRKLFGSRFDRLDQNDPDFFYYADSVIRDLNKKG